MVQIYTTPNCSSCRKVKTYFSKHNINYTEKNIFSIPLTREDVFKMLSHSENGFADIISTRSKIIKEENIDLEKMKTSELVDFIIANPSILKRPIILSDDAGVPQAMVELVVFVVETFDDMFVWVKVFVLLLYVPDMVVFFVLDARREPRFGADKTSVLLNIQVNTSSDVIKLFLILGIIT